MCRCLSSFSQEPASSVRTSYPYVTRDTLVLDLDVYRPVSVQADPSRIRADSSRWRGRPCVIFLFGGAFIGGRRDDTIYNNYFHELTANGIVVVSISYRLGLKGVGHVSPWRITPLRHAIDMAVEDVYAATDWVVSHAGELGIDASKILLSGSSPGAITVLDADCRRSNAEWPAQLLPAGFHYAGVIAFSGAILRVGSTLHYRSAPAPTLLFHGTADRIVPYNKRRFFGRRLYGSATIARILRANHYPYVICREEGRGHEIAVLPMFRRMPEILSFIRDQAIAGKPIEKDIRLRDPDLPPPMTLSARQLLRKLATPN